MQCTSWCVLMESLHLLVQFFISFPRCCPTRHRDQLVKDLSVAVPNQMRGNLVHTKMGNYGKYRQITFKKTSVCWFLPKKSKSLSFWSNLLMNRKKKAEGSAPNSWIATILTPPDGPKQLWFVTKETRTPAWMIKERKWGFFSAKAIKKLHMTGACLAYQFFPGRDRRVEQHIISIQLVGGFHSSEKY